MSVNVEEWKITRNNTLLGQVLSFTPSIDQSSVKSRSLDGTVHIQTIGTGVQKASVSVFSSWEEMIRVNEAEADGAIIRIIYRDRYYLGYISEAIQWETVEPYTWYHGDLTLLIEEKGGCTMRPISPEILEKINQPIQTRDNNSSFHNYIWIKRPTTELTEGRFIEKVTYLEEAENATDFDIAVCHPIEGYGDTNAFESYITNDENPKLCIAEIQIENKISKKQSSQDPQPEPIVVKSDSIEVIGRKNLYSGGKLKISWTQEYYASTDKSRIRITAIEILTTNGSYGSVPYYPGGYGNTPGSIKINDTPIGQFYDGSDDYKASIDSWNTYYPVKTEASGYTENFTAQSEMLQHNEDGSLKITFGIDALYFYGQAGNILSFIASEEITLDRGSGSGGGEGAEWPVAKYTIHEDPIGHSDTPVACAVAFDGTMPKDVEGYVQFITDEYPWVFCVYDDGKLMAKQVNSNRAVDILADENCTDTSAVRATRSKYENADYGLICFFIISGSVYYRQYINSTWMDAIQVDILPSDKTWTEIAAFRTWDYRIGLHAKNTDGEVYEVFTQFMGIGNQNSEHISARISAEGKITDVEDIDVPEVIRIWNE